MTYWIMCNWIFPITLIFLKVQLCCTVHKINWYTISMYSSFISPSRSFKHSIFHKYDNVCLKCFFQFVFCMCISTFILHLRKSSHSNCIKTKVRTRPTSGDKTQVRWNFSAVEVKSPVFLWVTMFRYNMITRRPFWRPLEVERLVPAVFSCCFYFQNHEHKKCQIESFHRSNAMEKKNTCTNI